MTDAIERMAEAISKAEFDRPDQGFSDLHPHNQDRCRRMASAALDALHPVIDTVEQLDALPAKSLVRCKYGEYWEKFAVLWDCLSENGEGIPKATIPLPARLLWSPSWRVGGEGNQ